MARRWHFRSVGLLVCAAAMAWPLAGAVREQAMPLPQGGTVSGRVATADGRGLPEMVVYLEAAEGVGSVAPPREPAYISQNGAQFAPSLLVISVGQAVEFRNDEDRPIEHNVFSQSPTKPFDLGLYPPGVNKTVTFDRPGVVRLFCSIHRYMDGVIYVCPTPFFAKVEADGRYAIEGVPPGEYVVKTWQRNQRYPDRSETVSVSAGTMATIDFRMSRR